MWLSDHVVLGGLESWDRLVPSLRLRVGAVATVAAVGANELAVEAVHLRAANLAILARRLESLRGLGLLRLLLTHGFQYTGASRRGHRAL